MAARDITSIGVRQYEEQVRTVIAEITALVAGEGDLAPQPRLMRWRILVAELRRLQCLRDEHEKEALALSMRSPKDGDKNPKS